MSSSDFQTESILGTKPKPRLIAQSACGAVFAVLMIYTAAQVIPDGRLREGGMALSFGFFAVMITTFPWFNEPSTKSGSAVLARVKNSTVRYELRGWLCLNILFGSMVIAMSFWIWFLAPPLLTFYFSVASRSVRNGWVELDEKGIRHRGWSFESELKWDSVWTTQMPVRVFRNAFMRLFPRCAVVYRVVSILPKIDRNRRRDFRSCDLDGSRITAWIWRIEKRSKLSIDLDTRRFDVHPEVLQAWIMFYAHNPKMRFELGTDAAAQRLASITP